MAGSQSVGITSSIGFLVDDDMFMPTVVQTTELTNSYDYAKIELSVTYPLHNSDDMHAEGTFSTKYTSCADTVNNKDIGVGSGAFIILPTELPVCDVNYSSDSFYIDLYLDSTLGLNCADSIIKIFSYPSSINDESDTNLVMTLSSSMLFCHPSSMLSTELAIDSVVNDMEVGKGRISSMCSSIISSYTSNSIIQTDCVSSYELVAYSLCDIEIGKGFLSQLCSDTFSAKLVMTSTMADIRTHSLELTNLSIPMGSFEYFGDFISIDVVDTIFDIDMATTFFEINGHFPQMSYVHIHNGVRMFCEIGSIFISDGKIKCTAHAHNIVGDYMYDDFYTLYGFSAEYYGENKFGYNSDIIVVGCATNEVQCPNTQCGSFTFSTEGYPYGDIASSVSCVIHADIKSEVTPQSTAFFYGSEYTVKISGIKDNSGNIMEDTYIRFKIEPLI
jgi:hypothetical protein